jgi:phosphoglucomutase
MAAYYKGLGKTLYEALLGLYEKFGNYVEGIKSITLKGVDGVAEMKRIMASLRANPPKTVNGRNIVKVNDYMNKIDGLPASDVLYFVMEDDEWICVRPSGTEPKIKIYFGAKGKDALEGNMGEFLGLVEG